MFDVLSFGRDANLFHNLVEIKPNRVTNSFIHGDAELHDKVVRVVSSKFNIELSGLILC